MTAPLPTPRGALTEALTDCFRGRGVARSVEADSHDDAALALCSMASAAHAQDSQEAGAAEGGDAQNAIVVTGSRIARTGFENPTPTTVVTAEQIANTGLNGGQEVPHFHVHLLGGKKIGPMVSK